MRSRIRVYQGFEIGEIGGGGDWRPFHKLGWRQVDMSIPYVYVYMIYDIYIYIYDIYIYMYIRTLTSGIIPPTFIPPSEPIDIMSGVSWRFRKSADEACHRTYY